MKTLKSFLVIGIILMASFVTPVNAQWTEAYYYSGSFNGFYFTDSLNGWFTHLGGDKIIHTSDGGYTFDVQLNVALPFSMYDVYMEDNLNGWACGSNTGSGPGYIYRTTNGGVDWVQVSHPASQSHWIQVEQVDSSVWFIGSYSSVPNNLLIMKTPDKGTTWDLADFSQFDPSLLFIFDSLNFIVYADEGLLARTSDGGSTWAYANLPTNYQVQRVAFLDDNIGYALVANIWSNPADTYLYRSTDSGFTWNLHYSWVDQGVKEGLSINPQTGTIFVTGKLSGTVSLNGILKSTDDGNTWHTLMEVTSFVLTSVYTPDPRHGWVAGGGKIYRYDYVEPPIVQPIPDTLVNINDFWSYQVQATGMSLKYYLSGQPQGLNIGLYTGLITGTPIEAGIFSVNVAVKDTDANVVNEEFQLTVIIPPPTIAPIPDITINIDEYWSYQVQATGWALNYYLSGQPNELNIGLYSGLISGMLTDTGSFTVTVTVEDTISNVASDSFQLTVLGMNTPPYFTNPMPDTLSLANTLYSEQLTAEDINNDTLSFLALQKPEFLELVNIDSVEVYSAVLSGTPAPSDTGYYYISIEVNDGHGDTDTLNWQLHVYFDWCVNHPPQFTGTWQDTVTIHKNSSIFWRFEFVDFDNDSLWALPQPTGTPGLFVLADTGYIIVEAVVAGTPTAEGLYICNIIVEDEDGARGSFFFWVKVLPPNQPPEFTGNWVDTTVVFKDSLYNWNFTFVDDPSDSLWTVPGNIGVSGLQALADSGVGTVILRVTGYPRTVGLYQATVQVRDNQGAIGQLQFWVRVDHFASVELPVGLPTEFALLQNYPNPFNPVTIIRYGLPQATEVKLIVYNLLGQEVSILINEYKAAGIYRVDFDGVSLTSGTYFFRLQAGDYIQIKKMVLLK